MDNQHYGNILRLNRVKQGLTIKEVYDHIDQNKYKISSPSYLSRIERGKENIKQEQLPYLFSLLGLEFKLEEQDKINDFVEEIFYRIIYNKVYSKRFDELFDELKKKESKIKSSLSYPKYLLLEVVIAINRYDQFFQYEFYFNELQKSMHYLENYQQQILYDCKASWLYYQGKYEQALEVLEQCDNAHYYDIISATIYYKKAIFLETALKFEEAIECIQKAKQYFDNCLCFVKSYYCYFMLANLYIRIGRYNEGEKIYTLCLDNIDMIAIPNKKRIKQSILNNFCWLYVYSKNYDKLIDYCLNQIKLDTVTTDTYFLLSWAYYIKDDIDLAKKYIQNALSYNSRYDDIMKVVVQTLVKILNGRAGSTRIENDLLNLLKKLNQHQMDANKYVFVLEMLIEYLHKTKQFEKEIFYYRELVKLKEGKYK